VTFSEPLDAASAIAPSNYQVIPVTGDPEVLVTRAVLTNATNIILTTSLPDTNLDYRLTVNGVRDSFGNVVAFDFSIPVAREVLLIAGDQQLWSYYQFDRDPEPGWWAPGFNYSQGLWATGFALFDAPGAPRRTMVGPDREPVRTSLNLTNPPVSTEGTITYYFRSTFNLPVLRAGIRLQLHSLVDDGAAFYLNGFEVLRLGMLPAPTPLTYNQFATRTQEDSQNVYEGPFELPASILREGGNVLAVEVHQSSLASSDLSFAARLTAVIPGATSAPALQIIRSGNWAVISWSSPDAVLQEGEDVGGPWQELPTARSPHAVLISAARRFYRLLAR
jgi:hypothetical protein